MTPTWPGAESIDPRHVTAGDLVLVTPMPGDPLGAMITELDGSPFSHSGMADGRGGVVSTYGRVTPTRAIGGLRVDPYARFWRLGQEVHVLRPARDRVGALRFVEQHLPIHLNVFSIPKLFLVAAALHSATLDAGPARERLQRRCEQVARNWAWSADCPGFFCAEFLTLAYGARFRRRDLWGHAAGLGALPTAPAAPPRPAGPDASLSPAGPAATATAEASAATTAVPPSLAGPAATAIAGASASVRVGVPVYRSLARLTAVGAGRDRRRSLDALLVELQRSDPAFLDRCTRTLLAETVHLASLRLRRRLPPPGPAPQDAADPDPDAYLPAALTTPRMLLEAPWTSPPLRVRRT